MLAKRRYYRAYVLYVLLIDSLSLDGFFVRLRVHPVDPTRPFVRDAFLSGTSGNSELVDARPGIVTPLPSLGWIYKYIRPHLRCRGNKSIRINIHNL